MRYTLSPKWHRALTTDIPNPGCSSTVCPKLQLSKHMGKGKRRRNMTEDPFLCQCLGNKQRMLLGLGVRIKETVITRAMLLTRGRETALSVSNAPLASRLLLQRRSPSHPPVPQLPRLCSRHCPPTAGLSALSVGWGLVGNA